MSNHDDKIYLLLTMHAQIISNLTTKYNFIGSFDDLKCKSSYLVYGLYCNLFKYVYIGETNRLAFLSFLLIHSTDDICTSLVHDNLFLVLTHYILSFYQLKTHLNQVKHFKILSRLFFNFKIAVFSLS